VGHVRLDLADLGSLEPDVGELDAVLGNAGVALDAPPRLENPDGNELMFGTNHLGHFALVARLMPVLAPAARIVTTGSFAAKSASLDSLTPSRPPVHTRTAGAWLRGLPARIVVHGKDAGARPAVRAVLDPDVEGGQLWGPRVFGLRGWNAGGRAGPTTRPPRGCGRKAWC